MRANFKRCFSYKWQPKVFKIVLNFSHKTKLGIFENISFRFLIFFFRKFQNSPLYPYMENQKPQLPGKREIVERKVVKFRTRG